MGDVLSQPRSGDRLSLNFPPSSELATAKIPRHLFFGARSKVPRYTSIPLVLLLLEPHLLRLFRVSEGGIASIAHAVESPQGNRWNSRLTTTAVHECGEQWWAQYIDYRAPFQTSAFTFWKFASSAESILTQSSLRKLSRFRFNFASGTHLLLSPILHGMIGMLAPPPEAMPIANDLCRNKSVCTAPKMRSPSCFCFAGPHRFLPLGVRLLHMGSSAYAVEENYIQLLIINPLTQATPHTKRDNGVHLAQS